ncbi:MAG: hypothetical protein A2511_12360 [Deltaproteobacteria bacterium RIFOXYD12_FULL_50_9]|nr:MAG: hypothetical protein A2511_12360 [Deltaproteobacteria bacterium RIFOXYD12_FULL_50_9]
MKLPTSSAFLDKFIDTQYGRINLKVKLVILVAACAIPLIIFFLVFVTPKGKDIKILDKKIADLNKEIQSLVLATKDLEKLKAEKRDTDLQFEAASSLLPQQKEISSLLKNISAQATISGLDITNFVPGSEKPADFYARIPLVIDVRGPFHIVGKFLDKISKLPRIVSVASMSLTSPLVDKNGEVLLTAKITMETYRFIEKNDENQKKPPKK